MLGVILIVISIVGGLVGSVISAFLGNIIIFDSILLAIVSAISSNKLLHIHPAFSLLIGIGTFVLLLILQNTRLGFWVIGIFLSLFWSLIFGIITLIVTDMDMIWTCVIFGLAFVLMIALHINARNDGGISNNEDYYYNKNEDIHSDKYNTEEKHSDVNTISDFFKGVTNIEELKKRYKDLLKIYHPDNQSGDTTLSQEIQAEYDVLLKKFE